MQEKNDIVIDYKVILAVLLAAVVVFVGVRYVRSSMNSETAVQETGTLPVVADAAESVSEMSAESGGVDVTVENVERADGKTFVAVTMNNHRYDLSDPTIPERTTLSGVKAERFEAGDVRMGGHHVTGEFVFEGELEGTLAVGVTDELAVEVELL